MVISTITLTGCDKSAQQGAMPPPVVQYIKVPDKEVGDYHEFIARTAAVDKVQIRARVEGFIDKRAFVEGGQVKKGALLFEIDPKPYIASLQKAKADLASSKAGLIKASKDLKRSKELFKEGYISQADLDAQTSTKDQALAAVEAARAATETARLNLSYTRIKAPFSGKVGKARYSVGNLVGPTSEPLVTLTSVDPIYVNFQVTENQLLNYEQSTLKQHGKSKDNQYTLNLRLPTGFSYDHQGKLNFFDTAISKTTGTLNLRASFPNPEHLLYPGLYVTLIAESKDKHLQPVIPQSAVQENQQGYFVIVIDDNNIAKDREVKLGRRIGPMWVVSQGIKPGEKLAVGGLQKIKINAPVIPKIVRVNLETGAIIESSPKSGGA